MIFLSRSTVYHTLRRYKDTGSHEDRARSGRPKVSTERDDRLLVRASLRDRRATVPELRRHWQASNVIASRTTVRRRLQDVGLHGHLAVKKPLLTPRHKALRLAFAREHEDWSWVDWSPVLFSDESKFNLFQSDGRVFVRRRSGERLRSDCVASTVKFGGGGVMMWGAMSYRGPGLLYRIDGRLNALGYIDILGDYAVPSAHLLGYGDNFIYQDDGAPCHRAKIVNEWKEENNFQCLDWPPQSPDLNPIENLWRDIKVDLRNMRSHNLRELEANVKACWDRVTAMQCRKLVRSMPRRIQAVLKANGGHTKY